MARCPAITRAGEPCRGLVRAGNDYCPAHDPDRSEARRKAASKAGRAKATSLPEIKAKLRQLADDVLAGRVDRADGSVAAQIFGVLLRAVEQERRQLETEELARRLEELEAREATRGVGQWRA